MLFDFFRVWPSSVLCKQRESQFPATFGRQQIGSFERCQRGASAVEFAIIAPLFIGLLLGVLAYGMYIGASHSVAQLTADAARASVAGLTDAERTSIAEQHVAQNIANFPLLDASHVHVFAAADPSNSSQFRVTVQYDTSDLPIWFMAGLVPLPDKKLERAAVIVRGGV